MRRRSSRDNTDLHAQVREIRTTWPWERKMSEALNVLDAIIERLPDDQQVADEDVPDEWRVRYEVAANTTIEVQQRADLWKQRYEEAEGQVTKLRLRHAQLRDAVHTYVNSDGHSVKKLLDVLDNPDREP